MAEKRSSLRLSHDVQAWQALSELALRGLRHTYGLDTSFLPHTMQWNGAKAVPQGTNVRYALISILGLARAAGLVEDNDLIASLWTRVSRNFAAIARSPGDLGLGLWARSLCGGGHALFSAERAMSVFRERIAACDSVDLAWLLLGADHARLAGIEVDLAETLSTEAASRLLGLYNPDSKLFRRHGRSGVFSGVSQRVPCFANQIYPVMALAVHSRRVSCERTALVGRAVADHLCGLQGPLGQWWWLYDASLGPVVDGHPVFSVHQDGMAPMALLETTVSGGRSFVREIEKGLAWIFGENELKRSLVLREQGLVLRDIHRTGAGRVQRMIRGTSWCLGLGRGRRWDSASSRCVINQECRPYHLGWILYAAALIHEAHHRRQEEQLSETLDPKASGIAP